jgi:4-amino-4-deoxy-L-arabinose transferase-like glycosyltransferase
MTRAASSIDWLRRRLDVTQPQLLLLAGILLVGTALRIVWVIYAARTPREFHDPLFYLFYANQISLGRGYRLLDGTPSAYYPIGYPGMLGALFFFVRHTFIPNNFTLAAAYLQIFLGIATVALAFYVGRRLFGVAAGLLAALWIALFPNLIYHTATYLSETLFNFLIMAALAVLVSREWTKGELGRGCLVAAGALLGTAALVRPIAVLLLPLLLIVWLIAGARWQRAVLQLGIVAIATVAVIMPWTIRNVIVMNAPILISANLGDDLCMGHHPGATGHFELPDSCFAGYDQYKRPEFEVRRNNGNTRKAVSFALHNPRFELHLLPRKAWWTYDNDHDGLWAVESYGDDSFIGSRFSLQIVPGEVPAAQVAQVTSELATITGLPLARVNAAIASGDPSAPVTLEKDLDIKIANDIRDAKLPGVHLIIPRSLLRQALARTADIFFFTTLSIGGLGLIGLALARSDPRRVFLVLATLTFGGVPLVFFGDARFHVPAMPLLSLAAAWAVVTAVNAAHHLRAQAASQTTSG